MKFLTVTQVIGTGMCFGGACLVIVYVGIAIVNAMTTVFTLLGWSH